MEYELIETVNYSVKNNTTTGPKGNVLCVKYELIETVNDSVKIIQQQGREEMYFV